MNIPVTKWTVSAFVTLIAWLWLILWSRHQYGDYNFAPAIMGFVVIVGTMALWFGLFLGVVLR
jgi:hypothetical protein